MSKPMPNSPHTRMRLTVLGAEPRYGSTNGAAISASAVSVSTRKRRSCITRTCSFAPGRAEQAVRAHDENQRHRGEQHHVRVAGIDHRGEADDLAGNQADEDRARERA